MAGNVMNLGHLLSETARRHRDRTALVWGEQSWSWIELDSRVNALCAALREQGLGKGDKILVQARNSNQMFETLWAAFKLGAVWVPCNFRLTPGEVAYLASSSGAAAMIADDIFPEHVAAVEEVAKLRATITIGEAREDQLSYEELVAQHLGKSGGEADVDYDDPCWFFYTSGTTGRPKAAVLTHGQMAFVVNNHLADLMPGTGPEDASLVVAPLSHGAGAHALSQVARGAKSVLLPGTAFDEAAAWRLVEAEGITNMFTVPTILTRLVRHAAVDEVDHSRLRYVIYAGAPMYREDQKLAIEKLGSVLVQYYGLGEVTGNITVLPPDLHYLDDAKMKIGSCGFARTGMEISIKSPDGEDLSPLEAGEICVRGPAVFAGYHENPEANANSLKGGWFHTGDLGHLDEEGYLFITGRASDMYISGGANVYPREAEEVLLTHPGVAEVAVLGVPDPQWGESGVAVVVIERKWAGATGSDLEIELLGSLQGKLAKYKWPRRVFFWESLPTSGYGKIPKHLIRQELEDRGLIGPEEII